MNEPKPLLCLFRAVFMEHFQMTGSGWKHVHYVNTPSVCIRSTLKSYVILVFPEPSKHFPGNSYVMYCCVRFPSMAGTAEASPELDLKNGDHSLKKSYMKIMYGFPARNDSG